MRAPRDLPRGAPAAAVVAVCAATLLSACTAAGGEPALAGHPASSSSSSSLRGAGATSSSSAPDVLPRSLFDFQGAIRYPSYANVVDDLLDLAAANPDLVSVWNAQERYGTPSPRSASCHRNAGAQGGGGRGPCKHYFLTITNRTTLLDDSAAFSAHESERPQVFFSGNLHGDEQVGPVTLVALAHLLVAGARPASPHFNPWIARLVNTRIITMIPITNPLGYETMVREEDHVDPNRDFPFLEAPNKCMLTATARAVNEVWRESLFQLAVTFHGGMEAIAWEWGAPNHERAPFNSESPDDVGQRHLAEVMREMAGSLFGSHRYPIGRMNNLVYGVTGGMEDWAYAGSWDTGAVHACNPSSLGGYPAAKTVYNGAQLRAINILVETWDDKRPAEGELGGANPVDMLTVQGPSDGHVPRNLRLALSVVDLVQPYVEVTRAAATGRAADGLPRPLVALPDGAGGAGGSGSGVSPVRLPPGLCVPRNLTASHTADAPADCAARRGEYGVWHTAVADVTVVVQEGSLVPGSITEADEDVSVWVGWDVGGAVTVDATSALIAPWDARVPTDVFFRARPGTASGTVPTGESFPSSPTAPFLGVDVDDFFVSSLIAEFGLPEDEAVAFAARLFHLQQVADGREPLSAVPAAVALRMHKSVASGTTRWGFGEAGRQSPPLVPRSTPPAGAYRPNSPIGGAPDLTYSPYETRFAHCFRVRASGFLAVADGLSAASLADCDPNDSFPTSAAAQRRAAAGSGAEAPADARAALPALPASVAARLLDSQGQPPLPQVQTSVRTFLVLPYANVDADFATQGTPDPAHTPPQSHWVNARTNPSWVHENDNARVRGRHQWAGRPVFVGVETRARFTVVGPGGGGAPPAAPTPSAGADPTATATATAASSRIPQGGSAERAEDVSGSVWGGPNGPSLTPVTAFFVAAAASALAASLFLFGRAVHSRMSERESEREARRGPAPWTVEEEAEKEGVVGGDGGGGAGAAAAAGGRYRDSHGTSYVDGDERYGDDEAAVTAADITIGEEEGEEDDGGEGRAIAPRAATAGGKGRGRRTDREHDTARLFGGESGASLEVVDDRRVV
jgi:hypothetical protein